MKSPAWLLGLCLMWVSFMTSAADLPATASKPLVKFGFYIPTYREMSMVDLKVSLQVWADEMAAGLGYRVLTTTYENMADLRADVDRGELQFINGAGMELAETFTPGELQRGFTSRVQGAEAGMALVVTSHAGLTSFADLKGKRLARLRNDRLSEIYLETQCLKTVRRPCGDFLTLTDEKRDIQSIYGVFFGKADAALVNLSTLKTAIDLNPQIASRLTVIQEWKTTAMTFGMLTRWADPTLTSTMVGVVRDTLKTVRGRQVMQIFKTDFVDPVEPSALNPYWALLKEYRALEKASGVKKK